jgi:hypothetical protein
VGSGRRRARNLRTGEEESDLDVLAFRDAAALTHSLETTGFAVARCYGDWQSTPVAADSRELIFVATRLS